jgi:hypothetical protein
MPWFVFSMTGASTSSLVPVLVVLAVLVVLVVLVLRDVVWFVVLAMPSC